MAELPLYISTSKSVSILSVFVQPRAAKDELVGFHGDELKIKVTAIPDEGRANHGVCLLLANILGVSARELEVVSGAASRHKRIAVPMEPHSVVNAVELVLSSRALGLRRGSEKGP